MYAFYISQGWVRVKCTKCGLYQFRNYVSRAVCSLQGISSHHSSETHTHTQMLKYDPLLYCRQWLLYSQEWLIIFKNGEILLINKIFLWSICARNMMEKHFLIFKCLSNCQELYTAEIMIIKNKCEGCRRRIVVRNQRERRKK